MTSSALTKLRRVSRQEPCSICAHTSWCGIADDGGLAICMRVANGAISTARNGGHVHVLEPNRIPQAKPIHRKPEPPPAASINRRHLVYKSLLASLELSQPHADNLSARGLSDQVIHLNGYATLPSRMREVCKICKTLPLIEDLTHVPGFFLDHKKEWRFVARKPGFLIPVRDVEGRIQALQIRQDQEKTRYVWFSSPGLPSGASSGAPIHFARPALVEQDGEAVITEGPLKADVIAEKLNCCVVGVPGVSSFAVNFGSWLTFKLPKIKRVLIAYDADWKTKPQVKAALNRLIESVAEAELQAVVLDWNGAKGLDDLLVKEVIQCQQ